MVEILLIYWLIDWLIRQLESRWQEYYHEFEKRAEEEREGNTAMVTFIIIVFTNYNHNNLS